MTDSDLISTAEAADILRANVATVNRWASSGVLAVAIQAPGRTGTRLYRRSDVEALAASRREAALAKWGVAS
jgi:predicted site-specific integrase-resolvase